MPTLKAVPPAVGAMLRGGRTTPSRVRTLTTLVLIAILGLLAVGTIAVSQARDGLRVIGHGAGPQVLATADMYYALSDMNAQVANILLIDGGSDLGLDRSDVEARYTLRGQEANKAVLQATDLAGDDQDQRETIQSVLDKIALYHQRASEARLLYSQASEPGDPVSERAIEKFRSANTLMKDELLPEARRVTEESDAAVQAIYEERRSNVGALPMWLGASGLAVIVLLLGLQTYLSVRFRRILNPALVLATVGTFALVLTSLLAIRAADQNLEQAKIEGHDRILEISGGRADNNTLQADEAIYRLDLQLSISDADQREAIETRMGPLIDGFASTENTMVALIEEQQEVFTAAISRGDASLENWHLIYPGAAAGIALLLLIGVRGRMAEYR